MKTESFLCLIGKLFIDFSFIISFHYVAFIPRGGYLIKVNSFEFWQGQTNRLHDRIVFQRNVDQKDIDDTLFHLGENGWFYGRLAP